MGIQINIYIHWISDHYTSNCSSLLLYFQNVMTSLRDNIESQLNEVEFLESLYDCVKLSPHTVREEFQEFVEGKLDDVYNGLTCTIVLKGKSTLNTTHSDNQMKIQSGDVDRECQNKFQ